MINFLKVADWVYLRTHVNGQQQSGQYVLSPDMAVFVQNTAVEIKKEIPSIMKISEALTYKDQR
jgi:hypothetical protein